MQKIPIPKFEKANDNTIRIIVENIQDVPLATILENREKLLQQRKKMQKEVAEQEGYITQSLKNIDVILAEAKKLGITVKPSESIPPAIRKIKEDSDTPEKK